MVSGGHSSQCVGSKHHNDMQKSVNDLLAAWWVKTNRHPQALTIMWTQPATSDAESFQYFIKALQTQIQL